MDLIDSKFTTFVEGKIDPPDHLILNCITARGWIRKLEQDGKIIKMEFEVEELDDGYNRAIATVGGWLPFEGQSLVEGQEYLVTVETSKGEKYITIATYHDYYYECQTEDEKGYFEEVYGCVIAYMPLPMVYTENGNE